jgi:hypothetical protein
MGRAQPVRAELEQALAAMNAEFGGHGTLPWKWGTPTSVAVRVNVRRFFNRLRRYCIRDSASRRAP